MTDTTTPVYFIRVRADGERRSRLLGRGGRETTRRLHALTFTAEQAERALAQLRADNPGFTFTRSEWR